MTSSSEDAGRRERFRAIYVANYPLILGFALRRCPHPEDAADVVAETFLAAWRRLDDAPAEHDRTWLYGIARRVLANHRRGQRRRHRLGERLREELRRVAVPVSGGEPEGRLEDIAAAFASLSERDREVIGLAAWEGLGSADLGRVLGCSTNAARIRLHRARRRFARHLVAVDLGAVAPPCTDGQRGGGVSSAEWVVGGLAQEDLS